MPRVWCQSAATRIVKQQYKDSATALNLKACNHFRLYNGKAAEAELKNLQDMASASFTFAQDLIKHNLVVFRNGEGALQVLTPLIDVIPEARLNLVIYFLRQGDLDEAFNLIQDVEPKTPQQCVTDPASCLLLHISRHLFSAGCCRSAL